MCIQKLVMILPLLFSFSGDQQQLSLSLLEIVHTNYAVWQSPICFSSVLCTYCSSSYPFLRLSLLSMHDLNSDVGLTFFFGFVLLILAALAFFFGSNMQKICQAIEPPEYEVYKRVNHAARRFLSILCALLENQAIHDFCV